MSDYTPISCEQYARFELWIIRGQRLRLAWREEQQDAILHIERVGPVDLRTREHVEYLVVKRDDGELLELRLDRISSAQPL
jgi:transcriptional antiterminator Rof (Rho-off)